MRCLLLLCGVLLVVGCHASQKQQKQPPSATSAPTLAEPVDVSVKSDPKTIRAGGTIEVLVVFDIAPTYEIQDHQAAPPVVATRVALGLPAGFEAVNEWSAPTTVRSQWPDGHRVYVGRATFSRKVRVSNDVKPGQHPLACSVFYQACNDRYCLPPVKLKLLDSLTVSSPAGSRQ